MRLGLKIGDDTSTQIHSHVKHTNTRRGVHTVSEFRVLFAMSDRTTNLSNKPTVLIENKAFSHV